MVKTGFLGYISKTFLFAPKFLMFFRAILISTSLCFVQSVMPEDALLGAWKKSAHKLWVKRLRRTSSLAELLQVLGDFVGAINEDRLYECNIEQGSCNFSEELIASFACMPQTTSAVALWLVRLDALIAPYLERAHSQKRLEISVRGLLRRPSRWHSDCRTS
ncbi:hypothetical protein GBA52_010825 [Prunus armeniaca]|nr:hypothetical protein GBA52_010825 [Prunus armeniaca]